MIWLPVLTTVAVVSVVGVLVIAAQQRQADTVRAADQVAETYQAAVGEFRQRISDEVAANREVPPEQLAALVTAAIATPPTLGPTSREGELRSGAYRDAQATAVTLLDPYRELLEVLTELAVGRPFIDAAERALALNVAELAGSTSLTSEAPVERRVIPAFEQARDELDALTVPPGQEDLAQVVKSSVQYVLDQASLLVSFAKLGQNYSFSYDARFTLAREAVKAYSLDLDEKLANAIDAINPR